LLEQTATLWRDFVVTGLSTATKAALQPQASAIGLNRPILNPPTFRREGFSTLRRALSTEA
jgi:hypothetical protein